MGGGGTTFHKITLDFLRAAARFFSISEHAVSAEYSHDFTFPDCSVKMILFSAKPEVKGTVHHWSVWESHVTVFGPEQKHRNGFFSSFLFYWHNTSVHFTHNFDCFHVITQVSEIPFHDTA